MSYEIIHKSTFTDQLLALPHSEWGKIFEKVEMLREAPQPDAKNKKRLTDYRGAVYRIRAGNYRIFYTFDQSWVALLGVDIRRDAYDGSEPSSDLPDLNPSKVPDTDDLLQPVTSDQYQWQQTKKRPVQAIDELPVKLDEELLTRLRVPDPYIPTLIECKTIDDLIVAEVPEPIRDRIFNIVSDPDYDLVLQGPSYVTGDVDDLFRYVEGELVDFLLKLDAEQERFVNWAVTGAGPTLVKGGPGTGKSTVALYRARSLIDTLRADGVEKPHILFTTYTNALVASSVQLLQHLLGEDARLVTVRTADSLMMEIVTNADGRPHVIDAGGLRATMKEALDTAVFDGNALQRRAQAQTIERLTSDYLQEEVGAVIEARELQSLNEYLEAPRAGRLVPLNATQRTAVWRVYEALQRALNKRGMITWEQLRRRAAEVVREDSSIEKFDGVIIDEAQDLDPTILRTLVDLSRTSDRIFVTADANQSIYGSSFRWTDVHDELRFRGRTGILRRNYRTTEEIGEAAKAYLRDGALDDDDQTAVDTDYVLTGPPPAVRAVTRAYDESELLDRFIRGAAREFHLGIGTAAVLVPSENAGKSIAARLTDYGLKAKFMPGRDLDLEAQCIKVITLKSAKGLEFPIVALAGFVDGHVPGAPRGAGAEETAEALSRERRTMYVAMTRAMRGLLVITPADSKSPLFIGFDRELWNAAGDMNT